MVAVDSDWDMIALDLANPSARERTDRILAASKAIAIKEPRIGRRLFGLFRAAGLDDVKAEVFSGADTVGRALPMLRASLARYAGDSGKIAAQEITRWLADIDDAIARGMFLFVLPQFVVRGVRH